MGLAGHQSSRNIQAVAYLALILSFSAFSFFSLTAKTVACFPGDIGTIKCPLANGVYQSVQQTVAINPNSGTTGGIMIQLPVGLMYRLWFMNGNDTTSPAGSTPLPYNGCNMRLVDFVDGTSTILYQAVLGNVGAQGDGKTALASEGPFTVKHFIQSSPFNNDMTFTHICEVVWTFTVS